MDSICAVTRRVLCDILVTLANGEKNVELSRQVLNDNNDYDPYTLFQFIDGENKNKITVSDIERFCENEKILIAPGEAQKIISFYDENYDGELSYMEFTNLIQSSNRINSFSMFSSAIGNNHPMSFNMRFSMKKIIEKEIELLRNIKPYMDKLTSQYDFNIHTIFNTLKSWTSICFDSINNFLTNEGISHSTADVRNMIKRLDICRDGIVDLKELHYFFGYGNFYSGFINQKPLTSKAITQSIEEKKLLEYFKLVIEAEESLEDMKISLAQKHDFNIENAFRVFDIDNKGYISKEDIKQGLFKLKIFTNDEDMKVLFEKYDYMKKNQMSYGDLFDMLVPYEATYRAIVEIRRPNNFQFEYSTWIYFNDLLKAIVEKETQINLYKHSLMGVRKRLKEFFAMIDKDNKGVFDLTDLENFLIEKKVAPQDLKGRLLLFIRLDKKRKGAVDYCDLLDEITEI